MLNLSRCSGSCDAQRHWRGSGTRLDVNDVLAREWLARHQVRPYLGLRRSQAVVYSGNPTSMLSFWIASMEYTLPDVATATMCVFSLKILKVTGQWCLPSAFLARVTAAAHTHSGSHT